jgi:hypothetical protein
VVDYWTGTVFTHRPRGGDPWPQTRQRMAAMVWFLGEALILFTLFVWRGHRDATVRWLLGTAVAFSVTYCLTHVQLRYRAPSEPVVAIAMSLMFVRSRQKAAA